MMELWICRNLDGEVMLSDKAPYWSIHDRWMWDYCGAGIIHMGKTPKLNFDLPEGGAAKVDLNLTWMSNLNDGRAKT